MKKKLSLFTLFFFLLFSSSLAFESDELLVDDDEFGLEGGQPQQQPQVRLAEPTPTTPRSTTTTRRRFSDPDSDSKIQFSLEHAFGDSDFVSAGTFSARLKTSSHGGQTLTKLRFSRNDFSEVEKENFEKLLQSDDFYRIRVPSNALSPPGRDYIISSVKAEGVNIIAVNYGGFGACPYPRQLKLRGQSSSMLKVKSTLWWDTLYYGLRHLMHEATVNLDFMASPLAYAEPSKWSFNSHTVLKNSEQAPRAPIFAEDILGGEIGEGEVVQPPERSFWAKYWMYLIPLGLIVMNAVTQAMNMPEEQAAAGQPGGQAHQSTAAIPRGPNTAVRRR
ncbi:hypothetical protein EZV62_024712 [Acer yangbiense]|uniref:ER membrane protein complex subunit 10 n=1 Tax=Acer yangbiense TaxID=1000413 RepID=A0A5C7GWG0_9ROSI|nr:hypothetical protein EZV62_024712 [Acer yangbiense]